MRQASWFVTVVVGLVVLASCAGPAVQEALPEGTVELSAVKTSLDQVEAHGAISRYGECGYEYIWFNAVTATHDDGFGGKTTERYVTLERYAHDWCADVYGNHWGVVQLDASAMRVRGNLGSVELRVDAELAEGYGDGGPVRIAMDLVLVGTGDIQTTRTKQQSDWGDGKYMTQTTDKYRQADVTGTIWVLGVPVALEDGGSRWGALRSLSTKTTYTGVKESKPSKDVSIYYLYAWPDQIRQGEPAYLEWQVGGRDPITLTIEPDVGDVSGTNGVTAWPTETTTYTLIARNRWSEASAEVTVYVHAPLLPDACEPNDDLDWATPWDDACVGTVLNLVPHDSDWFAVDLDAASRLTVDVDSRWDGGDWLDAMLAVFDETGDSIAMIDDWYDVDPYIEIDLSPGRYFVAITGYGDWGFTGDHWQEGEYELRFAVEPIGTTVDAYVQGTYLHVYARGLGEPDVGSGTRDVVLDVGWFESWRGPDRPTWVEAEDNWDAVWLFVKFRELGGAWRHATLTGAYAPSGAAVDVPPDGRGVFLYRPHSGYGEPEHDGYFGADEVSLAWAYDTDGVAADAVLEVRIFGIEMVYVPEGAFYAGSGGTGRGEFRTGGTDSDPFLVAAQGSIALGAESGKLDWREEEYSGTPEGSTDPGFPTGFDAFYVMKYELTQGQYVDFLNTLAQEQANARRSYEGGARCDLEGYVVGEYWTPRPHVPLSMVAWADGVAYADWAGLRPITELEFEKAARGPLSPVPDEYAWGSSNIWAATDLIHVDTIDEAPLPSQANANARVNEDEGLHFPIRVGAFASAGKTREDAGAGYFGALDLTGNLWENVVTLGHPVGRAFNGGHGDGALDVWGDANVDGWPGSDAVGAGFRGGNWYDGTDRARTSDRTDVAQEKTARDPHHGWRGVRTAP